MAAGGAAANPIPPPVAHNQNEPQDRAFNTNEVVQCIEILARRMRTIGENILIDFRLKTNTQDEVYLSFKVNKTLYNRPAAGGEVTPILSLSLSYDTLYPYVCAY